MEKTDTRNREKADRIYTVGLEGMEFTAFHGCREDEKKHGNTFIVNLNFSYAGKCGDTDALEDAVNYGAVYRTVAGAMYSPCVNLLETLADRIVNAVVTAFPEILNLEVNVRKKNPPVAGPCKWSYVTLKWERNA